MRIKGRPQTLTTEQLRQPLVILVPTSTVSATTGNTTVTYAVGETIWGMYLPENENRTLSELQVQFVLSAKVYVRYGATITNKNKLRILGNDFTIHSITDVDNRHEFYQISCFL